MKNEITNSLHKNANKIMELWQIRAQKEISSAFFQNSLALRNSLPEYLTQIMDALSNTINRTPGRVQKDKSESTRIGKKHGRDRGNFAGYSIAQLISEYHILRQTIFQVLEEGGPLPKEARDIIIDSIEQAVNDAATQFSETVRDYQEQVATRITHDLRTPITVAKLSAELIVRKPQDVQSSIKVATRIVRNMTRVDSMIQDLLDSSRIRAGKILELNYEEVDLVPLIEEVCADLNLIYNDRVKVKLGSPSLGYWSKQALWRTLENLISNAAKYGAPGSEISLEVQWSKNTVRISVHNFGGIIAPEEVAVLFDRHSRGRSARGQKGWGIGLSLVNGVVDAHHGRVWVESSARKGTTFFVELPRDFRISENASIEPKIESALEN